MEKFIRRDFRKLTTISYLFGFGHHHFTEFIKVHGSGAIFIELINDAIKLLVSQGGEQLSDQASEGLVGDEALVVLVVQPGRKEE